MNRLRSSIVTIPTSNLLNITFPNSGMFSTSASLGIAWANPSNHNLLLGPLNGLDFQNGCQYISVNQRVLDFQELLPSYTLSLILVDASGADLYTIGSTVAGLNDELSTYGTIGFTINAGSTPGAGIRGQLTIGGGGAMSVFIPTPVTFFGK